MEWKSRRDAGDSSFTPQSIANAEQVIEAYVEAR
jgi:hypothetical protein